MQTSAPAPSAARQWHDLRRSAAPEITCRACGHTHHTTLCAACGKPTPHYAVIRGTVAA